MIKMFGKPIRVNKASSDKKSAEVGANLFVGNLDPEVDEVRGGLSAARREVFIAFVGSMHVAKAGASHHGCHAVCHWQRCSLPSPRPAARLYRVAMTSSRRACRYRR